MLNNPLKESYITHQNWLNAIDAIRLLLQLCFEVRAHRGSSTAELLGDDFFRPITKKTSDNINILLKKLAVEISDMNSCILENKWQNILSHWQDKDAIDNFNVQTAYLESVNSFIWQLASKSSPEINNQQRSKKSEMCHFLLQAHSQAIESIAKLRGLSCYICAKKEISQKDVRLLRKSCTQALISWEIRQMAFISLDSENQIALFVKNTQSQLTQLLSLLIEQIKPTLKTREHKTNASQMFNQANQLLNQLQLQYDQGLDHLTRCMPNNLEHWLNGDNKYSATQSLLMF